MGLACQADESVAQYAGACIEARKPVEVGVLVGRAAGGKVLLLQLAPTPSQDGEPPASLQTSGSGSAPAPKKAGGKGGKAAAGGGAVELDREWVVEHAAQVASMLPGGLAVVGVYLLCPEAAFAGSTGQLLSLLHEMQLELADQAQELVVLHIDSVTGKLSTREFTGGAAGSLRPAELKTAGLLANMVAVHCRLELEMAVQLADPKQRLRDALGAAIERELAQRIQPALCLLGGRLQPPDAPLLEVVAAAASGATRGGDDAGSSSSGNVISMELLLPVADSTAALVGAEGGGALQRGRARAPVAGELQLAGVLDCRAYLQKREGAAAALAAIKQDVARTLRARARVLAELAEQQQEEAEAAAQQQQQQQQAAGGQPAAAARPPLLRRVGEAGGALSLPLPRRVFVPGPAGAYCYCDHLAVGEPNSSALSRAEELLALQPEGLAVEYLEAAAAGGKAGAGGRRRAAESGGGTSLACNLAAAGAAAVAGLALLVGYWSLGAQQ